MKKIKQWLIRLLRKCKEKFIAFNLTLQIEKKDREWILLGWFFILLTAFSIMEAYQEWQHLLEEQNLKLLENQYLKAVSK